MEETIDYAQDVATNLAEKTGFIAEHGTVALISALAGAVVGAAGVGVPWFLKARERKATLEQLKTAIAAIESTMNGTAQDRVIIGNNEVASSELVLRNLDDLNRVIAEHMLGGSTRRTILKGNERQEWESILIRIAQLAKLATIKGATARDEGSGK